MDRAEELNGDMITQSASEWARVILELFVLRVHQKVDMSRLLGLGNWLSVDRILFSQAI